jgi:glycosyltransferase involved in cell wall biosynthesis
VVVNGPSVDETDGVLEEFAGRIKTVSCPEPNIARSRNLGIVAAAAEIIAFTDDDAIPESPDWLAALVRPFAEAPDVGGTGGPVLQGDTAAFEFEDGATSEYGLQIFAGATPTPPVERGFVA